MAALAVMRPGDLVMAGAACCPITKQQFVDSILNRRSPDAFRDDQGAITGHDMKKDVGATPDVPTVDLRLRSILMQMLHITDESRLTGSPGHLGRYEDDQFKKSEVQSQTIPCYKVKKGNAEYDGFKPLDDFFRGYVKIFHDSGILPWNLISNNQSSAQAFTNFVQTLANAYDEGPGGKVLLGGSEFYPVNGCTIHFDADIMSLAGFKGLDVQMSFDGTNYTIILTYNDGVSRWTLNETRNTSGGLVMSTISINGAAPISSPSNFFAGNASKNASIASLLGSLNSYNRALIKIWLTCKELGDLLQVLLFCLFLLCFLAAATAALDAALAAAAANPADPALAAAKTAAEAAYKNTAKEITALGFSGDAVYSARLLDFCAWGSSAGCVRQTQKIDGVNQVILYLFKKFSEEEKLQRVFEAHKKDCIKNNEAIILKLQRVLDAGFVYLSASGRKNLTSEMRLYLSIIERDISNANNTIKGIEFKPDIIAHTQNLENMTSYRAIELFSIAMKDSNTGFVVLPKVSRLFINGPASATDPIFALTNTIKPKVDLRGLLGSISLGSYLTIIPPPAASSSGGARSKYVPPRSRFPTGSKGSVVVRVMPHDPILTDAYNDAYVKLQTGRKIESQIEYNGEIVIAVKNTLRPIIRDMEVIERILYELEPYFFHFNIAVTKPAFYTELLRFENITNLQLGAFYSFVVDKFLKLRTCFYPISGIHAIDYSHGGIFHSSEANMCDGTRSNSAIEPPDFVEGEYYEPFTNSDEGGYRKIKSRKSRKNKKSRKNNKAKYNPRTRRRY